MPSTAQFNFDGGEWAPEYWGRADVEKYKAALKQSRNMVILPAGSATRRPGFRFVAAAKTTAPVRLRRFAPSSAAAYQLEFGEGYIRFFRKRAPVLSGGVPFEVATGYLAGEVAALTFAQNLKQLFIFHPTHPPAVLIWTGTDTGFGLATAGFHDGPYIDAGAGATATPGALAASATVTFGAVTGINGNAGFTTADIGRHIRFKQKSQGATTFSGWSSPGGHYAVGDTVTLGGGVYIRPAIMTVTAVASVAGGVPVTAEITDPGQFLAVPLTVTVLKTSGEGSGMVPTIAFAQNTVNDLAIWGIVTAVADPTHVTVSVQNMIYDAAGNYVQGQFTSTDPIAAPDWRLGALCPYEGYPATGFFFQNRLIMAATTQQPKRWWGSDVTLPSAPYSYYSPTLGTMQVIASNGLDFTENDDEGDPIGWMIDCGKVQIPQFAIGAGDSEFVVQPSPSGTALSPLALSTYRDTKYTNAPVQPLRIGRSVLFADRSRQRLRSWVYQWAAGGFVGAEANPQGRHLLLPGIAAMDYALTPHPVLWVAMRDGSLAGLTFQLDEGAIAAWHAHPLGGSYYGGHPVVASLSVCPSEDAISYDETWIAVQRADIGGGATQTIEVSTPYFRGLPIDQAVFVDCAVSSPLTHPAATCTPVLAPSYAPSNNTLLPARGDTVSFGFSADVALAGDLNPGTVLRINNGTFVVGSIAGPRLVGTLCIDPPATMAPALANAWSYTAMATSFAGFAALAGRTVTLLADGQVVSGYVVPMNGTITLPAPASYVTAGLPYDSILETLDLDVAAPDGTSQGHTGRLDHLYLRLFESCGGLFGRGIDEDGDGPYLDEIEARHSDDLMAWAPPLRSGDLRLGMPGNSTAARSVIVQQSNPWPLTVTMLVARGGTQELAPR